MIYIITARRGSRRFPLKNTYFYKGKTLIQHFLDRINEVGGYGCLTTDIDISELDLGSVLYRCRPDHLCGSTSKAHYDTFLDAVDFMGVSTEQPIAVIQPNMVFIGDFKEIMGALKYCNDKKVSLICTCNGVPSMDIFYRCHQDRDEFIDSVEEYKIKGKIFDLDHPEDFYRMCMSDEFYPTTEGIIDVVTISKSMRATLGGETSTVAQGVDFTHIGSDEYTGTERVVFLDSTEDTVDFLAGCEDFSPELCVVFEGRMLSAVTNLIPEGVTVVIVEEQEPLGLSPQFMAYFLLTIAGFLVVTDKTPDPIEYILSAVGEERIKVLDLELAILSRLDTPPTDHYNRSYGK